MAGAPQFFIRDGEVFTECSDLFPSLFFLYNDHWIEVLAEDYVIDISERGDRSMCHLLIFPNSGEYFLMGLPLFQGYYTHHDMDN